MKKVFFYSLFSIFCFLGALAQSGIPDDLIEWETEYNLDSWQNGETVTVTFKAKIKEGYHIYSAYQPSKSVLPLTVQLDKSVKNTTLLELKEEGNREVVFDDIFQAEIASFHNELILIQSVKIKKKTLPIKFILNYQICNEEMCLPGSFSIEIR